jgi:hypothetical protein
MFILSEKTSRTVCVVCSNTDCMKVTAMHKNLSVSQPICSKFETTASFAGLTFLPLLSLCGIQKLIRPWLLKRNRSGQNYETFACFFAGQAVPEPLLQAIYRTLTNRIPLLSSFPVDPLDSLEQVYGLDCYRDDELTDFMNLVRTSCQLDFCNPVPAFLPCETVADLVFLLAARCEAGYAPTDQPCPITANARGNEHKVVSEWA